MKICLDCGELNSADNTKCNNCGSDRLSEATVLNEKGDE